MEDGPIVENRLTMVATGPVWSIIPIGDVCTGGDGRFWELVGFNPDCSEAWLEVQPKAVSQKFWYWNGACYIGNLLAYGEDATPYLTEESRETRGGPRALMEGHPILLRPLPPPPAPGTPGGPPLLHWYQAPAMYGWLLLALVWNVAWGIFGWSQRDPARNDNWFLVFGAPETFLFGWVPFGAAIIAAVRYVKPNSKVGKHGYQVLGGTVAAMVVRDHYQAKEIRQQEEDEYEAARRQSADEYRAKWQQAQTDQPPPPRVYNASGAEIPSPGRGLPL